MMAFVLHKRGHFVFDDRLKSRLPRTFLASAGMSVALYFAAAKLAPWLDSGVELERAFALATLVVTGLTSFAVLVLISGAARQNDVKSLH
jgi:putative peptidoglycan lipid II flippase